jgi:hypothetical protein
MPGRVGVAERVGGGVAERVPAAKPGTGNTLALSAEAKTPVAGLSQRAPVPLHTHLPHQADALRQLDTQLHEPDVRRVFALSLASS